MKSLTLKEFSSAENKKNFNLWLKSINKKKIDIKKIKIISKTFRKKEDFSTCSIDCTIELEGQKTIKRVVQIEGDSVVIIPVIKIRNEKDLRTILVQQIRVPVGNETIEFPSGRRYGHSFKMQAINEVQEELGIFIKKNDLKVLNRKKIFMIPSSTFGKVQFFYFKINLKKKDINKIDKKKHGVSKHGEFITTRIFKFKDILKLNNANVLLGLFLLKQQFITKKNEKLF